ncbi:hypothetical protein [Phenylobacterium deserti]|nr:hypothetical protein [Phenylobacterium deserti]
MADSTRELAARSDDAEIRSAYLELAAKWVRLAEQAARDVTGPEPLAPTSASQTRLSDDRAHA